MTKPIPTTSVAVRNLLNDLPARSKLRRNLRSARAEVLANSEGFEVVVHAIEMVGRPLCPNGNSLGAYARPIRVFVRTALSWEEGSEQDRALQAGLFLLKQTRNDYAHQGVHARNASAEAVAVALLLEEALSYGWNDVCVENVMVRRPVVAQQDDTLAEVRRLVLLHSFSSVPILIDGEWKLISDRWMAEQLFKLSGGARGKRLREPISAFSDDLPKATVCEPTLRVGSIPLVAGQLPELVLVAETPDSRALLGVLSPSDLL